MHCHTCNSERGGEICWKCGDALQEVHPDWIYPVIPDLERLKSICKAAGYAMALHGSLERDVDVVAVPWVPEAVGVLELVLRITEGMNARVLAKEVKPHNRIAFSIQIDGWFKLIDLSVMPTGNKKCQE